jgi:redox-sensitive bicupin YhaK (pirin superfamily)
VLAGEYQGKKSMAALLSPVALFHVRMDPGSTWQYELPTNYQTGIIYVRLGPIEIGDAHIPTHHTAYLSPTGQKLTVTTSQYESADFMLLAGEPLKEPVSAQGSMVMNSPTEISQAYADYQRGHMGAPWDHKISDEEWREHNKRFPSMYKQ